MVAIGDILKVRRDDIKDFPSDTIDTVLKIQREGWRASRTNSNHISLLAPDGVTRLSVSRNKSSNKYLLEDIRKYKAKDLTRVLAEGIGVDPKLMDVEPRVNVEPTIELKKVSDQMHNDELQCPDCEFRAVKANSLGVHRRAKHGYISPRYEARKKREARKSAEAISNDIPELKDVVQVNINSTNLDADILDYKGLNTTIDRTYQSVFVDPSMITKTDISGTKGSDAVDFIDDRDSWTMDLDSIMAEDLPTVVRIMKAAGLKMEIRVWKG